MQRRMAEVQDALDKAECWRLRSEAAAMQVSCPARGFAGVRSALCWSCLHLHISASEWSTVCGAMRYCC